MSFEEQPPGARCYFCIFVDFLKVAKINTLVKLSGIIIPYDPAAPGLNPKHNIYAFFNLGL